jgi:phosphoribosylaminoimidazolecarboxamide formyltransferase/IMP cyclohydrolase
LRALLSVSDREGITELTRGLQDAGIECVATEDTRAHLAEAEVTVAAIPDLADPALLRSVSAWRAGQDMGPGEAANPSDAIDIVVVNLAPPGDDIGPDDLASVAILRAAAANHEWVAAVSSPTQYATVLRDIKRDQAVAPETRHKLAADAFALTAAHDAQLASAINRQTGTLFPARLTLVFEKKADLRYGENPQQQAAFYADADHPGAVISQARQIAGKDLSFNNLLDLDAAWRSAADFKTPTVTIVKHGNPTGLASVVDLAEAFRLALEGDSVAAYGGIIGANRMVDEPTARAIEPGFFEAIVAPGYAPEAVAILGAKEGFEIVEVPPADNGEDGTDDRPDLDVKRIGGGLLIQTEDSMEEDRDKLQVVTERHPTLDELTDLLFAWRAVRHVQSNAVVLTKHHVMIGMGAGQPSRVVSVEIALRKAGERAPLSVMASDAYFPFPDGIQIAAQAGVTAIIQPGGSVRDQMAIEVADRHHMAMVFTGRRHFRH